MKVSILSCAALLTVSLCAVLCASCGKNDTPSGIPDRNESDDDPEPVRLVVMTVGELKYYGPFGDSGKEVFFLYLKDADPVVDCNAGLYLNVPPIADKTNFIFPEGTYTADSSWEAMTFTDSSADEGKSFWWTVSPEITEHLVASGSIEVKRSGGLYMITGLLMENDTDGIRISYKGKLPCDDCSGDTEKPVRNIAFSDGELTYYGPCKASGAELFFLGLNNGNPVADCKAGLYINVPPVADKKDLHLPEGTFTAAASGEPWTFTDSSAEENESFWWTVSPEPTRHPVALGSVGIERSGDDYTISGTLMEDEIHGIRIFFSGPLPAEDRSGGGTLPKEEVADVTMTIGELLYYGADRGYGKGGDIFFLYLKDADPMREYNMGLYVNTPKINGSELGLPDGCYTAASDWAPMTLNNDRTEKYNSHWHTLDPWTQHLLSTGHIEISRTGSTYTITGTLMENETHGLRIAFTGELPVEDYSS